MPIDPDRILPFKVGAPSKIDAISYRRDDGTAVTVAEHVVEKVRVMLLPWEDIAAEVGVNRGTIRKWKLAGAKARAKMALGQPIYEDDHKYMAFLSAVEAAELEAEQTRLGMILKEGEGGYEITKTVEKYGEATKEHPEGVLRERTVTVETAKPIWQANAWVLERRWPRKWGRTNQVELSGPNGAPVQIEATSDRAAALGESLRALQEGTTSNGSQPPPEVNGSTVIDLPSDGD